MLFLLFFFFFFSSRRRHTRWNCDWSSDVCSSDLQIQDGARAVVTAISALDKAVSKGIIHRNNAARRKSRLMQRLNKQAAYRAANPNAPIGVTTARGRNARPARRAR